MKTLSKTDLKAIYPQYKDMYEEYLVKLSGNKEKALQRKNVEGFVMWYLDEVLHEECIVDESMFSICIDDLEK